MGANKSIRSEHAPAPIGPYSQAVKAGRWIFCSGQIALDPATGVMTGGDDPAAQTRRVLDSLEAILAAAGARLADVVKTTIYLVHLGDFPAVNAVYGERFGEHPPARATVEVSGLPKGALLEIDAIAYLPHDPDDTDA